MKQSQWPVVQFAEILNRVERKIVLDDVETYDCVGVRWYGLGTFIRESRLGMDIRRKKQWIIKEGDIVYNKLFAWKGAFAIADAEVDGCIVSDKFPTYELDEERVDPEYLCYYFRTELIAWQAQDLSKGAAAISKFTLNPPDFWKLTIPLPPLDEQRRIVARIQELVGLIEEAQDLRRAAYDEAKTLMQAALGHIFEKLESEVDEIEYLADAAMIGVPKGWSPTPVDGRVPFIAMADIDQDTGRNTKYEMKSIEALKGRKVKFQPHAVLVAKIAPCTENNKTALVPDMPTDGGYATTEVYPVHPPITMEREYLLYFLRSPQVRQSLVSAMTGTTNRQRVPRQALEELQIPLPDIREQRRTIAYLDNLQAQVDKLTALQEATQAELDALLPSVLDRAFRGEL